MMMIFEELLIEGQLPPANNPTNRTVNRMVVGIAILFATIAAIAYGTNHPTVALVFGVLTAGQVIWYFVKD